MTKELPDDLAQHIRDYLNSVSLKAEALKHMSELADQVEDLQKKLDNTDNMLRVVTRERDAFKMHQQSVKDRENALKGREDAVAEREGKAAEMEQNKAVAEAKASVYHTCFELTMRNTLVRENVFRNGPDYDCNGNFIGNSNTDENTTRTTE